MIILKLAYLIILEWLDFMSGFPRLFPPLLSASDLIHHSLNATKGPQTLFSSSDLMLLLFWYILQATFNFSTWVENYVEFTKILEC